MRAATGGSPPFSLAAKVRKYSEAARLGLRNRLAYKGNVAGRLLTYCLFVFVFSRIWTSVFEGRPPIEGYGKEAAIWYFIVAEISAFGFARFFGTVGEDVKSGQIAYLLARPYSFVGYSFAQAIGPTLYDASLLALAGGILGSLFAGPIPLQGPAQALALLASLLLAACLQYLLQTALALTAFWVEENSAFYWIYQKFVLVCGTLIPLEFLPDVAQRVAFLTPIPWLTWAPARILSRWSPEAAPGMLLAQLAWTLAAAALCGLVFSLGRRRLVAQGG